jgi:hypothetical protein
MLMQCITATTLEGCAVQISYTGVAEPPTDCVRASMGRTRPKNRKARPPVDERHHEPTTEALLEKTQELIVQCDYDLAGRFLDRVLKRAPDNAEAKEMLGVVQLETGLLDAAKKVCPCDFCWCLSVQLLPVRLSYRCCRQTQAHRPRRRPVPIYILLS